MWPEDGCSFFLQLCGQKTAVAFTIMRPEDGWLNYSNRPFQFSHPRYGGYLTRSRTIGGGSSAAAAAESTAAAAAAASHRRPYHKRRGPVPPPGEPGPIGDKIDAWLGKAGGGGSPPEMELLAGGGGGGAGDELTYDFLNCSEPGLNLGDKADAYVKFHVSEDPQYHYPHLVDSLPQG